ncbi:prophage II orf27 protein [Helicobacter suis HS5]|uniref:Prophage II orf27 protein n=1 Tax=Helicobacter suis HS5 TaxID=710394 RepID=E7G2P9_9HELI|nr:hypothetical protein [Helicobacter suis]EFX42349.1 prophage II orf27 protein [Helicobacter suis HS5]BCD50255.1 hypothetical protein NHP194004_17020 [Helicobacter suis]BCD51998.1 hypothetical protein NHP194022_16690 [Helicobacter suis]
MNINRFIRNFLELREALGTQNCSTKELNSLCMQGALEFEKLYLQESQQALAEEQVKARIEIEYLTAQYNLEATKANTLNNLIQCASMLKSLKDNAAINRANAYVSFLQVVGNANNGSAIGQHANNVINTINLIGMDSQTNTLEECLKNLTKELDNFNNLAGAGDTIQIFGQSLETLINHPVKVWGFSTLKNSTDSFRVDNQPSIQGSTMLFSASEPKTYTITFSSANTTQTISKSLQIVVKDQNLKHLK